MSKSFTGVKISAMTQNTKRDQIWRTVVELAADPPEYSLTHMYDEHSPVEGFAKPDVRQRAPDDISERTVHDVIMTMVEYGLLEMVKEPSHASVREHPITGERVQMEIYAAAGALDTDE